MFAGASNQVYKVPRQRHATEPRAEESKKPIMISSCNGFEQLLLLLTPQTPKNLN